MPDAVTKKLQGRKADLEKEFEDLAQTRSQIIEQGKELQRKLSELEARLKQLQGAYAEVEALLAPEEKEKAK